MFASLVQKMKDFKAWTCNVDVLDFWGNDDESDRPAGLQNGAHQAMDQEEEVVQMIDFDEVASPSFLSDSDFSLSEILVNPLEVEGLVEDGNGQDITQVAQKSDANENEADKVTPIKTEEEEMTVSSQQEDQVIEQVKAEVGAASNTAEVIVKEKAEYAASALVDMYSLPILKLKRLTKEEILKWTKPKKVAVRTKKTKAARSQSAADEPKTDGLFYRSDLVQAEPAFIKTWKDEAKQDRYRVRLTILSQSDLNKYMKIREVPEEEPEPEMPHLERAEPVVKKRRLCPTSPKPLVAQGSANIQQAEAIHCTVKINRLPDSVLEKFVKKVEEEPLMPKLRKVTEAPSNTSWSRAPPTLELMKELAATTQFNSSLRLQSLNQPGTSRQSASSHSGTDVRQLTEAGEHSHSLVTQPLRPMRMRKSKSVQRKPLNPLNAENTIDKCSSTRQNEVANPIVSLSSTTANLMPARASFISIEENGFSSGFKRRVVFVEPHNIWSKRAVSLLTSDVFQVKTNSVSVLPDLFIYKSLQSPPEPDESTTCARLIPFERTGKRTAPMVFEDQNVNWNNFNTRRFCKAKIVIRPSQIHGRGLFTLDEIPGSKLITEYIGEVIRPSVCDVREQKYRKAGKLCYFFTIKDNDTHLVIDATDSGSPARYINHSCQPNCLTRIVEAKGKKHIMIYSKNKIPANTELTYDYMFEADEDNQPCSCGAKKCKGFM